MLFPEVLRAACRQAQLVPSGDRPQGSPTVVVSPFLVRRPGRSAEGLLSASRGHISWSRVPTWQGAFLMTPHTWSEELTASQQKPTWCEKEGARPCTGRGAAGGWPSVGFLGRPHQHHRQE